MAIPSGVGKIVVSGSLPGAEVWSVGMWYTLPAPGSRTSAQVAATNLANGTTANFTGMLATWRTLNPASVSATKVDVYYYTGGNAASDVGTASLNVVGSGTGQLPNQTCLVTTLRTASPTKSGRGRLFWPALAVSLGSNGLAVGAALQAHVRDVSTFLVNAPGVVVSTTQSQARAITSVTMDTRTDVMRSRANKLAIVRLTG